jgi:Na+/melibiose symporter-like transporter
MEKEELIKKIEKTLEEEEKLIISLKFFLFGILFSMVASLFSFYLYDLSKNLNMYNQFAISTGLLTAVLSVIIYVDFKRRLEKFKSLKWKHYLFLQKMKREELKKKPKK